MYEFEDINQEGIQTVSGKSEAEQAEESIKIEENLVTEPQEKPEEKQSTQSGSDGLRAEPTEFAHLKDMNHVHLVRNPGQFIGMVLLVGMAILFLTIFFSGRTHSAPTSLPDATVITNSGTSVEKNEKTIQQLENSNGITPQHPSENNASLFGLGASNGNDPEENTKAMQARRAAPTLMYSAFGNTGSGNVNPVAPSNTLSNALLSSPNPDTANSSGLVGDSGIDQFANHQPDAPSVVSATKMQHPNTTIAEGEIIPATLETAINSDLPGMVRAVITSPVYAYAGENVLVPAGSRLIGQYTSLSSNGAASERVFVIWNRILTPDGTSIMINSPGADSLGRAGMAADAIDVHFWKMFGTAALLSVMGATTANVGVSSNAQPNSADAYRESIASAMQQSSQNALNQNLNIQPTLDLHQGDSVTVFVAHDLDLFSVMAH